MLLVKASSDKHITDVRKITDNKKPAICCGLFSKNQCAQGLMAVRHHGVMLSCLPHTGY